MRIDLRSQRLQFGFPRQYLHLERPAFSAPRHFESDHQIIERNGENEEQADESHGGESIDYTASASDDQTL